MRNMVAMYTYIDIDVYACVSLQYTYTGNSKVATTDSIEA